MKKIILSVIVVLAFFYTTAAVMAQDKVNVEKMRIGFGVSLGKEIVSVNNTQSMTALDFPCYYLPLQIMPILRIEPFFGYYKHSRSNATEENLGATNFGAGLFVQKWYGDVDLYLGARVGWYKYSAKYETETTEETRTRTSLYFGPAFGGEYFFTNNLSIGGEIQMMIMNCGDLEVDTKPAPKPTNSQAKEEDITETISSTKTMFFIRWYL